MGELDGFAGEHGRQLQYNLSFRPIIAETEDAAWKKARQILESVEKASRPRSKAPEAETARRLSSLIEDGEIHDERLWVPNAAAAQGSGNSTALVGTPEQVSEAIAKYYDLGVAGVLIRGFDPFGDAVEFGKELIPWIRDKVRQRDEA